MIDLILEFLRAVVVGVALIALIKLKRSRELRNLEGWRTFLFGFSFLLFGALVDFTDNFVGMKRFVILGETPAQVFLEEVVGYLLGFILISIGIWRWLPKVIEHQNRMAEDLARAKKQLNNLQGLLPICSSCKKIRDDKGYWNQIESYISEHSEAEFSHGICPACMKKLYPEMYEKIQLKQAQQNLSADPEDSSADE